MHRVIFLFLFCMVYLGSLAQEKNPHRGIYSGFLLKNNGWGGAISIYQPAKNKSRQMASLSFNTQKHRKEVNIVNTNARNQKPYVFGKINRVGVVKIQGGYQWRLTDFRNKDNIQLSFQLAAGAGIVILKPVYLDIYHPSSANDGIVIPERYNPNEHINQLDILGSSRGRYGWNELSTKYTVGIMPAINVHWGGLTNAAKMFQTGAMIDFYPGGLPIMAFTNNPRVYYSLFMSFLIGNETEL